MRIYRWDLDKTYLETDFDTVRSLVRTATEPASAKRAVPGATAMIRALKRRPDTEVHIVSGSPTQMRGVLEEKLRLDGVLYDTLVLKDNLANLRRGRLRALRGQLGYKLPVLFQGRAGLPAAARETLFGDDAEADALVYSVYADALSGRLSPAEVARILEASRAYPDQVEQALDALARVETGGVVERIYIRLARGAPIDRFAPLGRRLVPTWSWWQAAVVLGWEGHLDADDIALVTEELAQAGGAETWNFAGWFQDLVRRGHLPAEAVSLLPTEGPLRTAVEQALRRLGPVQDPPAALPPSGAEYLALVRAW